MSADTIRVSGNPDSISDLYSDPTRLRVSDRNNQIEFATLALPGQIMHEDECIVSLDISPDGSRLATGGGREVLIWNAITLYNSYYERRADVNTVVSRLEQPASVNTVRYSPCSQLLAAAQDNGSLLVFHRCCPESNSTGDVMPECWRLLSSIAAHEHSALDMTWSPSGQFIAVTSIDNTASVWTLPLLPLPSDFHDLQNFRPEFPSGRFDLQLVVRMSNHSSWVTGIAWDPLGQCLASVDASGCLIIWSIGSKAQVIKTVATQQNMSAVVHQMADTGDTHTSVSRLSFSPDGSKQYISRGLNHSGAAASQAQSVAICIDRVHWTVECQYAGHAGIITVAAACSQQFKPASIIQRMIDNPDNTQDIAKTSFPEACFSIPQSATLSTHLPSARHSEQFIDLLPSAVRELATDPAPKGPYCLVALGDTSGQISIWSSTSTRPIAIFESFFVSAVQDIVWCASGSCFFACSYSGEVKMFRFGVFEQGLALPVTDVLPTLSPLQQRSTENRFQTGFRLHALREWFRIMTYTSVYCLDEINKGYEDIDVDTAHNAKYRESKRTGVDLEASFIEFDTREQCSENCSLLSTYAYPLFLSERQQSDFFDRRRLSRVDRNSIDVSVYHQIDHQKKPARESTGYSTEIGLPEVSLNPTGAEEIVITTLTAVSKKKRKLEVAAAVNDQPIIRLNTTTPTIAVSASVSSSGSTPQSHNALMKRIVTSSNAGAVTTIPLPPRTTTPATAMSSTPAVTIAAVSTTPTNSASTPQNDTTGTTTTLNYNTSTLTTQISTIVSEELRSSGLHFLSQACRQFLQNPITKHSHVSTLETASLLWYLLMPLQCRFQAECVSNNNNNDIQCKLTSLLPVKQFTLLVAAGGDANVLTTMQGVTAAKKAFSNLSIQCGQDTTVDLTVVGLPVCIACSEKLVAAVTLLPSVSAYTTAEQDSSLAALSGAIRVIQTSQYLLQVFSLSGAVVSVPQVLSVPPHSIQASGSSVLIVDASGQVCVFASSNNGFSKLLSCSLAHLLLTTPAKVLRVDGGAAKTAVVKALTQTLPEESVVTVKTRADQRALFHKVVLLSDNNVLLSLTDGRSFTFHKPTELWTLLEEPCIPYSAVEMYQSSRLDGAVCRAQRQNLRMIARSRTSLNTTDDKSIFPKENDTTISALNNALTTMTHFERQIMRASLLNSSAEYELFCARYVCFLRSTVTESAASADRTLQKLCYSRLEEFQLLMASQGEAGSIALRPPSEFDAFTFLSQKLLPTLVFEPELLELAQRFSNADEKRTNKSMLDLNELNLSWNQ